MFFSVIDAEIEVLPAYDRANPGRPIPATQLAALKSWKPGQSGNPTGRPRTTVGAIRRVIGEEPDDLVRELYRLALQAEDERVRYVCIKELLDRGWVRGQPQGSDSTGVDPALIAAAKELSRELDRDARCVHKDLK